MKIKFVVDEFLDVRNPEYRFYICTEALLKLDSLIEMQQDTEMDILNRRLVSIKEEIFVIRKKRESRLSVDCVYIAEVEECGSIETSFFGNLDVYDVIEYINIPRIDKHFYNTLEVLRGLGLDARMHERNDRFSNERFKSGSIAVDEIRVYNVQHGNMNAIMLSDESVFLFDFGSRTNKSHYHIMSVDLLGVKDKNHFNNLDLDKVEELFISHLHKDHWNYLKYYDLPSLNYIHHPKSLVTRKQFEDVMNTQNHATHIVYHNNVSQSLITDMSKTKIMNLNLYATNKGSGTNNKAILLAHIKEENIVYLTGDVKSKYLNGLYKYMGYKKPISIVVPHHGGNIGKEPLIFNGLNAVYTFGYGMYNNVPNPYTQKVIINPIYAGRTKKTCNVNLYDYVVVI